MVNAGSESHGEDALSVPEWINEEFFKRILDKDERESVKINKLLLSSGTTKTDNYASVLYRAKIKYALCSQPNKEKVRSFVMKTEHFEEGLQKDKLSEMTLFETEVRMYTSVLPMIEAKLREFGDQTLLAPKIFHSSLEMPRNIVFEDLVAEGYSLINNRPGSLEEIKLALKKLAKIHAISYQMAQTGNKEITTFQKTYVNTVNVDDFIILRDGVKLMKKVISDQPDLQKYISHFEAAEKFLFPKVLDLLNAPKNGNHSAVQVLNHGDFHMKNLMVQYVDNELKELMLLDYQTCIFGSPAIDLHYAFAVMYSPSMRLEKMDELLYYYTKSFQDTLHSVQYQGHIPTITEIRAEVRDYRHWGLYLICTLLCFNYAFMDGFDMSEMVESEAARLALFANTKILDELRLLLPRLLYLGYFEE